MDQLADFDDAEDFDDPEYDDGPVAEVHPSVSGYPKPPSKPYVSPSYADPHADPYADPYPAAAPSHGGAPMGLLSSKVTLQGNRLQWRSRKHPTHLLCDLPLKQIRSVRLKFAPSANDLLLFVFFAALTWALLVLVPSGWLRAVTALCSGLFAGGMAFGIAVTRVLEVKTDKREVRITIEDDVREAQAFVASLEARLEELHHGGPFR